MERTKIKGFENYTIERNLDKNTTYVYDSDGKKLKWYKRVGGKCVKLLDENGEQHVRYMGELEYDNFDKLNEDEDEDNKDGLQYHVCDCGILPFTHSHIIWPDDEEK